MQFEAKYELVLTYFEYDFSSIRYCESYEKEYKLELQLVPLLLPPSLNNEYSLTFGQLCEVVSKPIIL